MICLLLLAALFSIGSVYGENCRACNCQFSNIQVLTELVERIVNDTLLVGMRDDIVNSLQNHFGTVMLVCVCYQELIIRSYVLYSATWTPVNRTEIGQANFTPGTTFHFQIPDIIPNSASEFLLYASMDCGTSVNDISDNIIFYVEHGGIRFEKFLRVHSYHQSAWNTNSDNMWFPMPADRQIHVDVVPVTIPNCSSRLHAIGYR